MLRRDRGVDRERGECSLSRPEGWAGREAVSARPVRGMLNGELCAHERRLPRTECSSWRGGKREEARSPVLLGEWAKGLDGGPLKCVLSLYL